MQQDTYFLHGWKYFLSTDQCVTNYQPFALMSFFNAINVYFVLIWMIDSLIESANLSLFFYLCLIINWVYLHISNQTYFFLSDSLFRVTLSYSFSCCFFCYLTDSFVMSLIQQIRTTAVTGNRTSILLVQLLNVCKSHMTPWWTGQTSFLGVTFWRITLPEGVFDDARAKHHRFAFSYQSNWKYI